VRGGEGYIRAPQGDVTPASAIPDVGSTHSAAASRRRDGIKRDGNESPA